MELDVGRATTRQTATSRLEAAPLLVIAHVPQCESRTSMDVWLRQLAEFQSIDRRESRSSPVIMSH